VIVFLDGELVEKEPTHVVVNVNGIGYEASIPLSSYDALSTVGKRVRLLTVLVVREDAHLLFGFMTEEERGIFLKLRTISGIGPKLALAVLSGLPVRELKSAVTNGDVKRLSSISGVGKKTAERIVLELRDKLGTGDLLESLSDGVLTSPQDAKLRDALLALLSLGHKPAEAQRMVKAVSKDVTPDMSLEEILRNILSGRN